RLHNPVEEHQLVRRLVLGVAAHDGQEVSQCRTIALDECAVACGSPGGGYVHRTAVQLLDHAERREARTSTRPYHLEPPALLLTHVRPVQVENQGDAVVGGD